LWRCGLNRAQLMQIGLSLGADVPFFLFGQSAFGQGVGEVLTPVALASQSYLVIQPNQSVTTQSAFSDPDLTRQSEHVKITDFSGVDSFVRKTPNGFGKNDLEPVVFRQYPVVSAAFNWLSQVGFETRLTGSGGCLFSEYATPNEAVNARHVLLSTLSGNKAQAESGSGSLISNMFACDGYSEHPLRHWVND
jgi:4-diphosphocytidyl-2-C-methyl-D-erythritol kinase